MTKNALASYEARTPQQECTTCNVCDTPCLFDNALEKALVRSNILKFKNNAFTVWRCNACGSLHSKEIVDLAHYYKHYPLKNHVLNFPTRLSYRNRLIQLKKHRLQKKHSLLDYGCGTGLFVKYLKEKGFANSFGFDSFVDEYADSALLKLRYDIVTAQDVIEHTESPASFLIDMANLAKNNGLVVIGTPKADFISLNPKKYFAQELHQPYHRHILSKKALLELAIKANLKLVGSYNRFYFDTLCPGINTRFLWHYANINDGIFDVLVEPPKFSQLITNPGLLWDALTGYFFPPDTNMMLIFRKSEP